MSVYSEHIERKLNEKLHDAYLNIAVAAREGYLDRMLRALTFTEEEIDEINLGVRKLKLVVLVTK